MNCRADPNDSSESRRFVEMANPDSSAKSLPDGLHSVLAGVKARSHVPILLPSALPESIARAKYAVVEEASASKYAISLYLELGIGDAGYAGSFSADAKPKYHPRDLRNVREVNLSRGIRGFFRPVSCGGSCVPANLWWEQGGILYQIQLELRLSLSEDDQQKTMTATADSAILAGPR